MTSTELSQLFPTEKCLHISSGWKKQIIQTKDKVKEECLELQIFSAEVSMQFALVNKIEPSPADFCLEGSEIVKDV